MSSATGMSILSQLRYGDTRELRARHLLTGRRERMHRSLLHRCNWADRSREMADVRGTRHWRMPCESASRMVLAFADTCTHHSKGINHTLRIAQVAPLTESVPPRLYGGTERVVSFLTDELVRIGHDVTLFASGDSETRGRLVAAWPRALRLEGICYDPLAPHLLMLEQVVQRAQEFDVIHFHTSQFHFPIARRLPNRSRDDIAWAARHPRARTALPRIRRYPGRLDFRCAARTTA